MNDKMRWVNAVMKNDEDATDEEMVAWFVSEGPMSEDEARFYVAQRNEALRNPFEFNAEEYKEVDNV